MTPTFHPPDDGFDDALLRSQRRRRRRHAVEATTGVALAAAVAVFALSSGPAGLTTLRVDQPAATPGPEHQTPSVPLQPSPFALPTVDTGQPTSPSAVPSTSRPVTAGPRRTAPGSAPETAASDPRIISTPLTRTTTSYDNLRPCADSSGRQATGWCVQPASSFSGVSDQPNTHAVSLCRLPGAPAADASFPSTSEASFALIDNGSTPVRLWSSEKQHPGRTSRHEVRVDSGRCLTWTLTWFGRNDDSRPTPAGRYALAMAVRADNINTPTLVEQQYDYTVTE